MTRNVPSLSWLDTSEASSPLATYTLDFGIDLIWSFDLRGSYGGIATAPRGVVVDNTAGQFAVTLVSGVQRVTINPYSRLNVDFLQNATNCILSCASVETLPIAFYVNSSVASASGLQNQLAVQQAVQQAITSAVLGNMNPIINSKFEVLAGDVTLPFTSTVATNYVFEGWEHFGQAGIVYDRIAGFLGSRYAAKCGRAPGSTATGGFVFYTQILSSDAFQYVGSQLTLSFDLQFGADFLPNPAGYQGIFCEVHYGTGIDENLNSPGFTGNTLLVQQRVPISTAKRVSVVTPTIPVGATQLGIALFFQPNPAASGAQDWFAVSQFQFDTGGAAQSYRPLPNAFELDRCLDSFEIINESNINNLFYCIALAVTTTQARLSVTYKRKLKIPTVSFIGNFFLYDGGSGALLPVTSFAIFAGTALSLDRASVLANVAGPLTLGAPHLFEAASAPAGSIRLNARL